MTGARTGFTLVSALFLLVAITAAGAFLLRVASVQRESAVSGWLGAKAYHAARSGIEWKLHQVSGAPGSCPPGPPTTDVFTLGEAGLAGFDVTVTCESDLHVEAGVTTTRFQLVALAERGAFGDRDYVSRRIEATLSDD